MKLRIYQVDAFSDELFKGNPAAVCPLEKWLSEKTMQQIAMENNLAETAFYVRKADKFHIRWFTPEVEVDLCGHATLAAAHVLFHHEKYAAKTICFDSRSGELTVRKENGNLILNFPADPIRKIKCPQTIVDALGRNPRACYKGKTDYLLVFPDQKTVTSIDPDFKVLAKVKARGIIVTAKGDKVDFVSRFFAPASGIDEDPVTGSAHTTLVPYWSEKLGKNKLTAMQISKRTGMLFCMHLSNRVEIGGKAVTYLVGDILI